MAPRRGGSGSSSGSGSNSCPDAFLSPLDQASFANNVVFFAIFLGITIALCVFRKKSVAGKGLLGLPLIGCLAFFLLTYVCSIISITLLECQATSYSSFYAWQIAIIIFTYISYWLFLVVVVFNLNTMLRRQLDVGHSNAIFKIVPLAIIGIIGILSCAMIGISAYLNSTQTIQSSYGYGSYESAYQLVQALPGLRIAYYSLYLVSLLVSGALSLVTIMSLRKARKAGGDLFGWIIALTVAMVFWTVLMIVFAAWRLRLYYDSTFTPEASVALAYLVNFGQALSFIFILCVAKHISWRKPTGEGQTAYQPQYTAVSNPAGQPYQPYQPYGYNANANAQAYQYHEAPEFVGTNNPVRA